MLDKAVFPVYVSVRHYGRGKRDMANKTTKQRVAELLTQGWTPRQIARELDLSTQRIYQHMEQLRAEATAANGTRRKEASA